MLLGTASPPPRTIEELLGRELAARLDRLDVFSRKVLSGKLPGERRSKRRGRSVEFDDFRDYVPGDDLRHIDWNIYARLDRLIIKMFREEEDLALHVLLDASPSMLAGNPAKLVYAARLAAALAYIGLVNQNRVSLAAFGVGAWRGRVRRLAPIRGRTNLRRAGGFLIDVLDTAFRGPTPTGDPDELFASAMRAFASQGAPRGIAIVISDFLMPVGGARGLSFLTAGVASGSLDAYAVRVLSPGEQDPSVEPSVLGDLRLTDVESGEAADVTVTPESLRVYRDRFASHAESLRRECFARGIALVPITTDTPVDRLILGTLRRGGLVR